MKTQVIKFKDLRKIYSVVIGQNVLRILPSKIKNLCPKTKKIVVIMDKNVPTIFHYKLNIQGKVTFRCLIPRNPGRLAYVAGPDTRKAG